MAQIVVYAESDAYVYVTLQRQVEDPPGTWSWQPDTGALEVVFELFKPDGTSIGEKTLASGEIAHVGAGKYRALFHFPVAGIYKAVGRCTGSGGGNVTVSGDIAIEEL